jgi:glycosyltransferase involved in cell wall biosynthesis
MLRNERRNVQVLREELDKIRPDIVLVWGMAGLSNCLLWEIQRRGVKLAFAVHDHWPRHRVREDPWYQWWSSPQPFGPRVIRRALYDTRMHRFLQRRLPVRRPTELDFGRAFFASRALRETIRNAGYRVDGSDIISACIGRDEFPGQSQRRDDLRRVLWIGPLDTDHDPMTAIQAIQELRHNGEMRFSLDIFGRGDVAFESRLHDYLRDSQLGGAVTIRHTSVEELVQLFPTYDLFLYTARYPEPFPLVILRAMAAHLPVVTTVEGSCADLVRQGENAITFRTGDPVDCGRKIFHVASEREAIERITEVAYREVLDNYSAITVTGRVERFLNEVMGRNGAESTTAVNGRALSPR